MTLNQLEKRIYKLLLESIMRQPGDMAREMGKFTAGIPRRPPPVPVKKTAAEYASIREEIESLARAAQAKKINIPSEFHEFLKSFHKKLLTGGSTVTKEDVLKYNNIKSNILKTRPAGFIKEDAELYSLDDYRNNRDKSTANLNNVSVDHDQAREFLEDLINEHPESADTLKYILQAYDDLLQNASSPNI